MDPRFDSVRAKHKALQSKAIPDDYTNHFFSHFGFYEDNSQIDKEHQNRQAHEAETQTQSILRRR